MSINLRKVLDIIELISIIRELACKLLEPLMCTETVSYIDVLISVSKLHVCIFEYDYMHEQIHLISTVP